MFASISRIDLISIVLLCVLMIMLEAIEWHILIQAYEALTRILERTRAKTIKKCRTILITDAFAMQIHSTINRLRISQALDIPNDDQKRRVPQDATKTPNAISDFGDWRSVGAPDKPSVPQQDLVYVTLFISAATSKTLPFGML